MSRLASTVSVASLLLLPVVASAHARLVTPVPRVAAANDNNGGIKEAAAPCGGAKPATPANTYAPGQTIMLEIQETIQHVGHYELYWSDANDANLTAITGMTNIANADGVQNTKVSFTMPNKTCDNCTLQMRMVMMDPGQAVSNYYSCADIRLATVPAGDMGVAAGTDMAPGADMATTGGSTGDAGATAPGDMTMKAPVESVGLPGCNVGGNGSPFTLFSILFAIALVALPRLRPARVRR